jgi:hypothetical protein
VPSIDGTCVAPGARPLRRSVKKFALALTAAATLTLAGCGEGDEAKDKADPSPSALTKTDFLKQANAICKTGEDKINAAAEAAFGDAPDEAKLKAFTTDVALPETQKIVDGLRELEAPEELASDFDALLDSTEADLAKVKADWEYGIGDEAFADANTKANAMGLEACGA